MPRGWQLEPVLLNYFRLHQPILSDTNSEVVLAPQERPLYPHAWVFIHDFSSGSIVQIGAEDVSKRLSDRVFPQRIHKRLNIYSTSMGTDLRDA